MNSKWLLTGMLLLGASIAGAAPQSHQVTPGQTLSMIAKKHGYGWKALCAFNSLASCHVITPGQTIRFPGREARPVPVAANCITLGVAPFNPEHRLGRTLQGIDLLTTLSAAQKEVAKRKVALSEKADDKMLVGQQTFKEMLYQSASKKVLHVYDKPICLPEQGGRPEVMDTYDLGEGVFLSIPKRCGNPSVFEKPRAHPAPQSTPEPLPTPQPAPHEPSPVSGPPEEEEEVAVRDYDWDLGFYVGGDKDVRYAGGEGAGYPFIRHTTWGRYALGGGGNFGLWQGGTPDGYRYSGETAAFGLAQKFSFSSRRDIGIKFPMIGGLWERGHDATGEYQQKRQATLLCASVNYTDASREKDGKTAVPEWQIWGSYCDPLSQSKSHSFAGQALDTAALKDVKYILGVGGRVFLSKSLGDEGVASKLQPFVELGANKTAPNPVSGHAYLGLRTVDKVWGLGVGPHFAEIGTVLGATLTYDAGRHFKNRVAAERWQRMVESLEKLGVAVD